MPHTTQIQISITWIKAVIYSVEKLFSAVILPFTGGAFFFLSSEKKKTTIWKIEYEKWKAKHVYIVSVSYWSDLFVLC